MENRHVISDLARECPDWDLFADTPEQYVENCMPSARALTDEQRAALFARLRLGMKPAACTLITAPEAITKSFELVGGMLRKETHATITAGTIETREFHGLEGFAALLESLEPTQALCYGLSVKARARLMTAKEYASTGRPSDALTRTASAIPYASRPGVLALDYDPPPEGEPLSRDALVSAIRSAAPGLSDVAMLWWTSASSCIFDGERELRGVRGQRLYMLVEDASDIPRAGKVLESLLWASGFGRFDVSKSGALMPRTLFDAALLRPNQPDFAAGAICVPPLDQRRGRPARIDGPLEMVDTREALPEPAQGMHETAKATRDRARAALKPAADARRAEWIAERRTEYSARVDTVDRAATAAVDELVERAVERRELGADWCVHVLESGRWTETNVGEILDCPARFHRLHTLDPLEPDYDGSRAVGILFLYGVRPVLHSQAHGGATFRLVRTRDRIQLSAGRERDAVDATLDVLRRAPGIFDFGGQLVSTTEAGRTVPLDDDALRYELGGIARYYEVRMAKDETRNEVDRDPPLSICRQVIALGERRALRPLEGVITAPTLRPDGTPLLAAGYDEATRLLLSVSDEEAAPVPLAPTPEECRRALETLWRPFARFPFVSPVDRGVMLAALLTACIRPTLETSPGFAFDAPEKGSGKTLLAKCVAALATGERPDAWSPIQDDVEMRKRLFAALSRGDRVMLLDNIVGLFNSAALAALMTSGRFTDRVLGHSTSRTVPNRTMILLTGNNITVVEDMARRVLRCRIDSQEENPATRRFDFDPLAVTLAERQPMVVAGLTLIRGYLAAGEPDIGSGGLASFEDWERRVRQTVLWVSAQFAPGRYADPRDSIIDNQAADPETELLAGFLSGWFELFGPEPTKVADVLKRVGAIFEDDETPAAAVSSALNEWTRNRLSSKAIGRALMFRKDRIAEGLRLEEAGTRENAKLWRVRRVG